MKYSVVIPKIIFDVYKLTPDELAVYAFVLRHQNIDNSCEYSLYEMPEDIGLENLELAKALDNLSDFGLINIEIDEDKINIEIIDIWSSNLFYYKDNLLGE